MTKQPATPEEKQKAISSMVKDVKDLEGKVFVRYQNNDITKKELDAILKDTNKIIKDLESIMTVTDEQGALLAIKVLGAIAQLSIVHKLNIKEI